jgi:hypothetical protein
MIVFGAVGWFWVIFYPLFCGNFFTTFSQVHSKFANQNTGDSRQNKKEKIHHESTKAGKREKRRGNFSCPLTWRILSPKLYRMGILLVIENHSKQEGMAK